MFVAWRDLRAARGRFALIASVVALIMLLVGFLAGLTGGLAQQNVSAILSLPGDRLVLAAPDGEAPDVAESALAPETVAAWRGADGVDAAVPVGIVQGRAAVSGSEDASGVALIGMPRDAGDGAVAALAPGADDQAGLSAGAAEDLGARVGDTITVAGLDLTVASIGDDAWYSHTPVIALTPDAWAQADVRLGGTGEPTLLAVTGDPAWDTIAADTSTSAQTPLMSLRALETFTSEIGSLGLMIAMLFAVSALVIGAFFTVWTLQRTADVAVLKALGASNRSLVRDALGQALVVLAIGIALGLAATLGLGALAGSALPFLLSPLTTLVPAVAMAALGLAGAAAALRAVTSADPLTALGSNR